MNGKYKNPESAMPAFAEAAYLHEAPACTEAVSRR